MERTCQQFECDKPNLEKEQRRGSHKKAGGQGRTLPGQPRTAAQPRAAIRRRSRRRACAARAWVCGRPIKRAGGPAGLAWGRRAARKGQAHLDRAGSRSRAPGGASPEGARAGPEPRPRPGRVDSSCAARHSNALLRPAAAWGRVQGRACRGAGGCTTPNCNLSDAQARRRSKRWSRRSVGDLERRCVSRSAPTAPCDIHILAGSPLFMLKPSFLEDVCSSRYAGDRAGTDCHRNI